MKITVIGTGYVGLVVGACLAETGNDIVCADLDAAKIESLRQNVLPIYEPGLDALVERNQVQRRLAFTTDVGALSTYTTLWRYDSYAEREEKRALLQADRRWQDFLGRVQPLMHTQQNRILVPTSFSPLR